MCTVLGKHEIKFNEIAFKQTWSLSNATYFKHDNNVCTCALILLLVGNLVIGNGFCDIDFLYDGETFTVRRCLSPNYGNFSVHMCSFDHITTSGLKSDVIFEFSAPVFL